MERVPKSRTELQNGRGRDAVVGKPIEWTPAYLWKQKFEQTARTYANNIEGIPESAIFPTSSIDETVGAKKKVVESVMTIDI